MDVWLNIVLLFFIKVSQLYVVSFNVIAHDVLFLGVDVLLLEKHVVIFEMDTSRK
jgi:hypothetical protein